MEGGQGRVYVVVDSTGELKGEYILKELKNPKRVGRFEREMDAIRTLPPHENVVELVEKPDRRDAQKPVYVMERAEGTLADLVNKDLELSHALELFEQICAGVAHCHAHGVVHRDLKPDNVLVFGKTLRVSDFGLSFLLDDEVRLTETGEAVGPRFYMAPELEDGRTSNVAATADVYSLGKILYFLLSGGRMFSREKHRTPEYRLDEDGSDPRLRLMLPVLDATLQVSRHSRPTTAGELLELFQKKRSAFDAHPRSSLLRRFSTLQEALAQGPEVLGGLAADELAELLAVAVDIDDVTAMRLLDCAQGHLAVRPLRDAYVKLLLSAGSRLPPEYIGNATGALFRIDDAPLSLVGRADAKRMLGMLAHSSDIVAVTRGAIRAGWWHEVDLDLLQRIAASFDEVPGQLQTEFLLHTRDIVFDGKEDFLASVLSRTPEASETDREIAIWGLCKLGTESARDTVVTFAREGGEMETGMVVRGAALAARSDPELLRRLASLDNPVLRLGLELLERARDGDANDEGDAGDEADAEDDAD